MKTKIGALKFLLTLENASNIHRNYVFLCKRKRIFVNIRIVAEIVFSIVLCATNSGQVVGPVNRYLPYYSAMFMLAHILNGFTAILYFGPYYGRKFRRIIEILHKSHEFAQENSLYNRCVQNLKIKCHLIFLIYVFIRVLTTAPMYFQNGVKSYKSATSVLSALYVIFNYVVFVLFKIWIENRYFLGVLMFWSLTSMLCYKLTYLSSLIKSFEKKFEVSIDQLEMSASIYNDLSECSGLLTKCFGPQILISLTLSTIHFISLAYRHLHMFYYSYLDIEWLRILSTYTLVLVYVISTVAVASVGQRVQREYDKLAGNLTRLCNTALSRTDAHLLKELKDFHRLASVKPIAVRLSASARPVGMYLLPAVLAFTIDYIVVMLQLKQDV